MTRELIIPPETYDTRPVPGQMIRPPGSNAVYRVGKVHTRRIVDIGHTTSLRLILSIDRVKKADIPEHAAILVARPPKPKPERKAPPAATPRDPVIVRHRIRSQRIEDATRTADRIREITQEDDQGAPAIRRQAISDAAGRTLREATTEDHEWVDPEDVNPNRRIARKVRGQRGLDMLELMKKRGSPITARHLAGANSLRRTYDVAEGIRPGWQPGLSGGAQGGSMAGPQDRQLAAIRKLREIQTSLGRLYGVIKHVVLLRLDVSSYARSVGLHRNAATGYLLAALDALADICAPPIETKRRHTIRE